MLTTPRDFRTVRAAVVERNSQLRSDMRLALLEKGISEPTTHRTPESFLECAGREMLDLVVCDTASFDGDFAPSMQRIRQHALGGNPFVVVIATVNDASLDTVQQALNGGVDDLMRKPAAAKTVVDRIDNLVAARKPFIATRSYVGPSRAHISGEMADAPDGDLIQVPNTLRARVVEKANDAAVRRAVAVAVAELKEKIDEHPLAGIERLIRRAVALRDGDEAELRRHFNNLRALSVEMSALYRGGDHGHIANLALALSKLAHTIARRRPPEPTQVDLDLLNHLGGVVRGAMVSNEGSKATIQEIAAMVDRYAGGNTVRGQTVH